MANAPSVMEIVGGVISPVVKSLPKSASLTVSTVVNGKTIDLGLVKTSVNGTAIVPAFRVAKSGMYIIQLNGANGSKYFVKVVVRAKKK